MKTLILATIVALSLNFAAANAQSLAYNAPAYNYYQNNWSSSGG